MSWISEYMERSRTRLSQKAAGVKARAVSWASARLDRMVPPGFEWPTELRWLGGGLALCSVISLGRFFIFYFNSRQTLYESVVKNGMREFKLVEGRMIGSFAGLMMGNMTVFLFLAAIILLTTVYHYLYYVQESKSIYLMRRLPNRFELHRRSFSLPLLSIGVCLCAVLVLILICFCCYCLFTPKGHVPAGQWRAFWESGIWFYEMWIGGRL